MRRTIFAYQKRILALWAILPSFAHASCTIPSDYRPAQMPAGTKLYERSGPHEVRLNPQTKETTFLLMFDASRPPKGVGPGIGPMAIGAGAVEYQCRQSATCQISCAPGRFELYADQTRGPAKEMTELVEKIAEARRRGDEAELRKLTQKMFKTIMIENGAAGH